jgi:hypothetical protein
LLSAAYLNTAAGIVCLCSRLLLLPLLLVLLLLLLVAAAAAAGPAECPLRPADSSSSDMTASGSACSTTDTRARACNTTQPDMAATTSEPEKATAV